MLSFPPTVRVYLCNQPVDMRKSYNGLCGCVEQLLGADPLSGHLFVFFNRKRTMVKILVWDRTGFCLYCKRLEQGRFQIGAHESPTTKSSVDFARLLLLLEGLDLREARQRKRYALSQKN